MMHATRREVLTAAGSAVALSFLGSGCAPASKAPAAMQPVPSGRPDGVRTGGSRKVSVDGRFEVWVKQVGTGNVPVLTLHGGPGFPHFYFECFEDFLPRDRIRFWYYDQLGCGFSDRPDEPSLWTVERFRKEVEQVRLALGLESFVLYGQSWGGMLAIEYALAYPQYLSGLVISNMTASIPSYVKYVNELRAAMPPDINRAMKVFEDRGDLSRAGVPATRHGSPLLETPLPTRPVAGASDAILREFERSGVQHHARPERVHSSWQLQGLGSLGRPAPHIDADTTYGRPIRHDVCGRYPANG